MKQVRTTQIHIYQCLCVLCLWGKVFIKLIVIFKTELHYNLFLIGYGG